MGKNAKFHQLHAGFDSASFPPVCFLSKKCLSYVRMLTYSHCSMTYIYKIMKMKKA